MQARVRWSAQMRLRTAKEVWTLLLTRRHKLVSPNTLQLCLRVTQWFQVQEVQPLLIPVYLFWVKNRKHQRLLQLATSERSGASSQKNRPNQLPQAPNSMLSHITKVLVISIRRQLNLIPHSHHTRRSLHLRQRLTKRRQRRWMTCSQVFQELEPRIVVMSQRRRSHKKRQNQKKLQLRLQHQHSLRTTWWTCFHLIVHQAQHRRSSLPSLPLV